MLAYLLLLRFICEMQFKKDRTIKKQPFKNTLSVWFMHEGMFYSRTTDTWYLQDSTQRIENWKTIFEQRQYQFDLFITSYLLIPQSFWLLQEFMESTRAVWFPRPCYPYGKGEFCKFGMMSMETVSWIFHLYYDTVQSLKTT